MQSPLYVDLSVSVSVSARSLTYVHVVEALVDVRELAVVRDVLVDLDLALEVVCARFDKLNTCDAAIYAYPRPSQGSRCGPSHHRRPYHATHDQ